MIFGTLIFTMMSGLGRIDRHPADRINYVMMTTVMGMYRFNHSSSLHHRCTFSNRSTSSVNFSRCSASRSEEHTSELQSRPHLVCRLLLEKKKKKKKNKIIT